MKPSWIGYKRKEKYCHIMNMNNIKQFQKKRKVTLTNIESTAKKNASDAEFSDNNSPIEKEKGVNDRKYEKNKKYNEDKQPVFPDGTYSVEMEEYIIERKYESKKCDEGKEDECPNDTPSAEIEEYVGDRNDDNNGYNYEGKEA